MKLKLDIFFTLLSFVEPIILVLSSLSNPQWNNRQAAYCVP